jgi:hypothetical protein
VVQAETEQEPILLGQTQLERVLAVFTLVAAAAVVVKVGLTHPALQTVAVAQVEVALLVLLIMVLQEQPTLVAVAVAEELVTLLMVMAVMVDQV